MTIDIDIHLIHGGTCRNTTPASSHRYKISIALVVITVILLVFHMSVLPAVAAEKSGPASTAPTKSEAQPEQRPNPSAKGVTESASKAGVKACADRIYRVTDFLTKGLKSGAVLFTPPSESDKRLISVSLGLETPGGKTAYASESFAPNGINGCSNVYETVAYWEGSCLDVAKKQFPNLKKANALVNNLTMLDGGNSVKVFLMPAGTGCVAIKKEVLH